MDCTKTLRLRIKDKHRSVLDAMAHEVNQVWNFCNETSHRAIRECHQFLTDYDLQKLTNGFSKCDGIHIGSPTVQQVCEDYAKARKQFKKTQLGWCVSTPQSSKYSLGWIPFKACAVQYKAGQIAFAGQRFSLWDSYGLADYELRAGSFSQGTRGRWYLNVAVASSGERIEGRFYRKLEAQLRIAQRAHKKQRVRAIHAKIANQRKDLLHQFSTKLVKESAAIFVGDVTIGGKDCWYTVCLA
ncbi:MAG: transposase [Burkholderiaceae bacterium]|nr:transposase [Burkholderiaceae bacterium]